MDANAAGITLDEHTRSGKPEVDPKGGVLLLPVWVTRDPCDRTARRHSSFTYRTLRSMGASLRCCLIVLVLGVSTAVTLRAAGADRPLQYSRTSWTERHGLPSNRVGAIVQDRRGYLWLGTPSGVVRFDGTTFLVDGPFPRMAGEVAALCVGADGSLWVAYRRGGVDRLLDGRLASFDHVEGLVDGPLSALLEDRTGTIWAGGRRGLSRFSGDKWQTLGTEEGLPGRTILRLAEDRAGNLWAAGPAGVFVKNAGRDRFEKVASTSTVRAFSEGARSGMWIADSRHAFLQVARADSATFNALESSEAIGMTLIHDRHDNIWAGTWGNGLLLVRPERAHADTRSQTFTMAEGLPASVVLSLFEDREGNIWVGTEGGLVRFSETWIETLPLPAGRRSVIRSMTTARDGSIWAATPGGVVRFTQRKAVWYDSDHGLPNADATIAHETRRGEIVVTTDRGLARYVGGRFVPVPIEGDLRSNWIRAMTSDDDGHWWLCDYDGAVFKVTAGVAASFSEIDAPCGAAFTDARGRVWLGLDDGLVAIANNALRKFRDVDGLAIGRVYSIVEDPHGTMWIGTATGLSRFKDERFVTIRGLRGLNGRAITSIVDDHEGYLWLGTSSGIVRISAKDVERSLEDSAATIDYQSFSIADGMEGPPVTVNYPMAGRAADGALWFVTARSVAVVEPARVPVSRPPPAVRIEAAVADGQTIPFHPHVRLPSNVDRLQIQYAPDTLSDSSHTRFRFRLEGLDKNWIDAAESRAAVYMRIPPGSYRFRVMAGTGDGRWGGPEAAWDFRVLPAFYQTTWFYGLCSVVGLLAAGAAWQLRLRQVRARLDGVLAERSRLAREVHDTLLQGLAALELQVDTMRSQLDSSPGAVKRQLDRSHRYIQRCVSEARQSILNLRAPVLDNWDVASALKSFGESGAEAAGVRFVLTVTGRQIRLPRAVEDHLVRIGQEAITNALRHSRARQVRTEVEYADREVRFRVSDDGIGFSVDADATTGGHWGLVVMRERAEQIGARLTLTSQSGRGTTIEVVASVAAD